MQLTVCVLLYGDHAELARRCLTSLRPGWESGEFALRLGCNAVSKATEQVITEVLDTPGIAYLRRDGELDPRGGYPKYPLMRRLFYDVPLTTPYVMWFDDDSFLRPGGQAIFRDAPAYLTTTRMSLLGALYTKELSLQQRAWIQVQPWANPACVVPEAVLFCTGGWWTARAATLQALNYPWSDLYHNGGDVMLGVALSQQGFLLPAQTPPWVPRAVAINANHAGQESRAPRRGLSTPPFGADYERPMNAVSSDAGGSDSPGWTRTGCTPGADVPVG